MKSGIEIAISLLQRFREDCPRALHELDLRARIYIQQEAVDRSRFQSGDSDSSGGHGARLRQHGAHGERRRRHAQPCKQQRNEPHSQYFSPAARLAFTTSLFNSIPSPGFEGTAICPSFTIGPSCTITSSIQLPRPISVSAARKSRTAAAQCTVAIVQMTLPVLCAAIGM